MDYKISLTEASPVAKNLRIEVPQALYQKRFNKVLRDTAGKVSLKGFRPGKAPLDTVAKLYGHKIHHDIVDDLFREGCDSAIQQNELKVVGISDVKFEDGHEHGAEHVHTEACTHDLVFTANLAILPEPVISNYKGLSYAPVVRERTEEDLEQGLKELQEQRAKIEPVEGRTVAELGDFIRAEVRAILDGKSILGNAKQDFVVDNTELGTDSWPKGLEQAVVGMSVGESKSIEITFDADFENKELAGKTVNYEVKLLSLSTKKLPELTDEFAKQTGMAEDLAGLKKSLEESIDKRLNGENEEAKTRALLQSLIEANPFEVPTPMIDEEIRQMLFEFGVLNPQKQESFQLDMSRFRERFGEEGAFRVKRSIVVTQVMKQEGIEVNDQDIEAWLEDRAKTNDLSRERVNSIYNYPKDKERLHNVVAYERTLKMLFDNSELKAGEAKVEKKKKSKK